jgi:hypothetical protein
VNLAFVVDSDVHDELLAEAIRRTRDVGGRICVMAVSPPVLMASVGAPWASVLVACEPPDTRSATDLARAIVERVPTDIPVTYAAFSAWDCPRLLARLQSSDFDVVLLDGWPQHRSERRALIRASRTGRARVSFPPTWDASPAALGIHALRRARPAPYAAGGSS